MSKVLPPVRHSLYESPMATARASTSTRSPADDFRHSHVPDPRPKLLQIGVKALIMRGSCDFFIPWESTYESIGGTLPRLHVVPNRGGGTRHRG